MSQVEKPPLNKLTPRMLNIVSREQQIIAKLRIPGSALIKD